MVFLVWVGHMAICFLVWTTFCWRTDVYISIEIIIDLFIFFALLSAAVSLVLFVLLQHGFLHKNLVTIQTRLFLFRPNVHEKTANYHRNRQQICSHRRKTCEQFYQPLLANFLTPEFFNIFTKNHFPTMRFQSFDYTHKLLNFGYPTGGQFDILSGEWFNSVLDAHCYRC